MKVLLTGGAGYIGSHTALAFLASNYEVVIADDLSNSKPIVLERLKQISNKDFKFYQVDVKDKKQLDNLFSKEKNIKAVVHFAGFKAVGESVEKPLKYYRNNLDSLITLLEVMEEHKVNNLIFSSSATVYGKAEVLPLFETSQVGPCSNPYGWTKLMIEQIITDYCTAHPNFHAILLRYFNPVGAHKSGLIGEDPNGIPNNLMPYISQVAVGLRPFLNVYGNDYPTKDGTGVRDYIHVVDLADGHLKALDYVIKHPGLDIFNLGTGRGYSVLEIVKAFEEENKVKIPYVITERRPGDIAACYADASKANKLLGWQARYNIKDMVRDAWNWQKKNPKGYE